MTRGSRRVKQWIKRVPGVQPARRRALRKMRHSASMRSFVKQVFAVDATSTAPVDVAPGRVLGGVGTESLPVVLVVIVGANAAAVDASVDEVARLQLLGAGFRPVFVIDTPAFSTARGYGYPVELLVDRKSWEAGEQDLTWDEYARDRLALLFGTYRATASVSIGPGGMDEAARLVLGALRPV